MLRDCAKGARSKVHREESNEAMTDKHGQVDKKTKKTGEKKGVRKDYLIGKESMKMEMNKMLPGGRGKGTSNEAQKGESKEIDIGTTRNTGEGLVELTLQVRVEGIPNQPSGGDKKTGTGRPAGSKGTNQRAGKAGCESSPGKALIKNRSLEKEGGDTKEEETKLKRRVKNTAPAVAGKKPDRTDDLVSDEKDYHHLLKLLRIKLPVGVLSPEVIKESQKQTCIRDAKSIVTDLENFKIQFCITPRLGCREVKRALALMNSGDALELTKIIFFEAKKDDDRKTLMEIWKRNSTSTGKGFRMQDRYTSTPISTPEMYSTAITRGWSASVHEGVKPTVTDGVRVNTKDMENMNYFDESILDESGSDRFGRFHQNKTDEIECLKFFHGLGVISSDREKVRYTKGNKVECGFLTGRLDFLAKIPKSSGISGTGASGEDKRLVIECKGTTGDMVGKVFTKRQNGECQAQLIKSHEYCYQTQAYMYILNRDAALLRRPRSNRAVMVIRHYHRGGNSPQDFHWNYLQLDKDIQTDIEKLRAYCQRDVLACFLAVLDLIFQKEIT
ncbi:uncharacterized protein LOC121721305 isoform X1 [Alosa sapidissima]|uniref:uncharacterized protein LOC121721305 isoform X1 n=1 Tax=Alosa sapidissima TaxID=34773 RepID=UPI001C0915A5|nr:uncharacterized protein LOC121721305 isoform X1 [Alosa sapidissima]